MQRRRRGQQIGNWRGRRGEESTFAAVPREQPVAQLRPLRLIEMAKDCDSSRRRRGQALRSASLVGVAAIGGAQTLYTLQQFLGTRRLQSQILIGAEHQ